MDESAASVTLASGLSAVYEPTQNLVRDDDGRQITLRARFYIDGIDADGAVLDIRAHDWLQFTDFRGVLQKKQVIVRASPWFCGAVLDHVLLEIS